MNRLILGACGTCIGLLALATAGMGSPSTAVIKTARQLEDDPRHRELVQAEQAGDQGTALAVAQNILAGHQLNLGLSALAKRDLSGAAANFERVLGLDPTHHRARAELARTYYSMGEFVRARSEFARVLAAEPPDNVRRNLQHFIDLIDEPAADVRNWSLSFTVGALYDDNVNYGPAADFISVQPLAFGAMTIDTLKLTDDSKPQDANGVYTYLSGFAHHDVGEQGAWGIFGQASYYQTWLDDAKDFAIQYVNAAAGPRHRGPRHLFDLPVRYEHINRGGESLVDIAGVSPALLLAGSHELHWITSGAAEYRDYAKVDDLDSAFLKLGQSARRTFGRSGHDATAGLFAFAEQADSDVFSNRGWEAVLATSLALPLDMRADLRAQYRGQWFVDREELAPEDRQDDQMLLEARLKKNFTPIWGIAATYQYTRNYSTFDLYDFERNFVTIGLVGDL